MGKEGKSMESVTAPLSWLESGVIKKGEARVKKKEVMRHFFFFTKERKPVLKEKLWKGF